MHEITATLIASVCKLTFDHSVVLLMCLCSICEVVTVYLKVCLKLCSLFGKLATEAYVFTRNRTQVFKWFGHFKHDKMNVEDHTRSGRPSSSRNNENFQQIDANCHFRINEISENTGVSWSLS